MPVEAELPASVLPGLRGLGLPDAVVEAAVDGLQGWRSGAAFASYAEQIDSLIARERWDVLADAFRQVLPFGTGGRRGMVGVGPNRVNPWTIGTSVEGHIRWLRARFGQDAPLSVVIAWDSRRFDDAAGIWDPSAPNPVLGLTSRSLGELAARIYAKRGVRAILTPSGSDALVSTPELSFSIRHLGASGGLNLSASHNQPDDNGVKVYDHRGAQLVPPDDEELLRQVAQVADFEAVPSLASEWILPLEPAVHRAYVARVASLARDSGPRRTRIVYTPLHGTGVVDEILAHAGFDVERLAAQSGPDGAFPTVPGHLPNPERPEALALAIRRADEIGATLVLATDPDADRIGCAVRDAAGKWTPLDGNAIAAIVVRHAVSGDHAKRPLIVKTEVTSTLVQRVADAVGAAVVGDLLVGFKYVADGLRALEEERVWRGFSRDDVEYVAGCEESHGVLVTPDMRDKDAAGGGLFLAEAADRAAAEGKTLVDVLADLAKAHGRVRTTQLNLAFAGASGQAELAALIERWSKSPPAEIAGRKVTGTWDHRDPAGRFGPIVSGSDKASRTVLVYHLAGDGDDGARVILRPSGTEPKLKVYLEMIGTPGGTGDDSARWERLVADVKARV